MQAAFYMTPIFYTMDFVANKSREVAQYQLLNPIAQIIQDSRHVVVTTQAQTIDDLFGSGLYRMIPILLTVIIIIFAGWYFKRRSSSFAEEV
jgi:ABC-2 type transport system permease protein